MGRFAALASSQVAREAAEEICESRGSAMQAALTGFFASAAQDPGVLFSPVSLLVGGLGAGVFAYDGRCRQPGREAKRPRGFVEASEVPATARVAVPGSVAALAVACAFQAGTTLLSCVRPAVQAAKSAGHKERAALLELVASLGATCLQEPQVKRAFLSQFGAVEQGTIAAADLGPPADVQNRVERGEAEFLLPWASEGTVSEHMGEAHGILAVDAKGLFVALGYRSLPAGETLAGFDITLPSLAAPVMRGVTRVAPGSSLPAPVDLRIGLSDTGRFERVSAQVRPGAQKMELYRDPETQEVSVPRTEF